MELPAALGSAALVELPAALGSAALAAAALAAAGGSGLNY